MAQLGCSKSSEAKSRVRGKSGGGGGVKGNVLQRSVSREERKSGECNVGSDSAQNLRLFETYGTMTMT